MSVNLSIKDVPDELAEALRQRAQRNHRSLQGELMAMIESHAHERPFKAVELWEAARTACVQPERVDRVDPRDRDSR